MLEQSFIHIKGIGGKVEKLLWENNINDWNKFLKSKEIPLSKSKIELLNQKIIKSKTHFKNKNISFFSNGLPINEHWRLFNNFKSSTAYLDIETTGLYPSDSEITTIALYDGINVKTYVNGKNLGDFKIDILDYNLLVTYNGKSFDIPFIEKFFNISLTHSHIDLRYVLNNLGYSGGLKSCEKQFGLSRNNIEGIDGFFAIYLWEEYINNKNDKALETLLAYNIEDVVNLEYLMHKAYNLKLIGTPFENNLEMLVPVRPIVNYEPHMKTIKKIKRNFYDF
jgi:uncharacterized protein YprB with RNaseH-like and TPR domain